MPEHVFTVVARGLSVDAQTNVLTLFGIVSDIGSPVLPVAIPELSIVTLWRRQAGEEGVGFIQRTQFVDPDGNEVAHFDTSFRFETMQQRILGQLTMVPFQRSGCHRIRILIRCDDSLDWQAVAASYPIEITLHPTSAPSLFKTTNAATTD